ncbi:MAG: helix-turn-helix domain-containing protein [Oscillospiraceae bacterium]|nr:helix-turn-helix domain-containing protein [Oscillospiraceae bacterium]
MNPIELKCARIRHGKTTREMAEAIGNSMAAYNLRERGVCPVTLEDARRLGPALGLSKEEFFTIFFDGDVPYREETEDDSSDADGIASQNGSE